MEEAGPPADLCSLIDGPSDGLRAVEHVMSRSHGDAHAGLQHRETRPAFSEGSNYFKEYKITSESEQIRNSVEVILSRKTLWEKIGI